MLPSALENCVFSRQDAPIACPRHPAAAIANLLITPGEEKSPDHRMAWADELITGAAASLRWKKSLALPNRKNRWTDH